MGEHSVTAEARVNELEAELIAEQKAHAKTKFNLEIASEFCDSPCGHSSMWAYTEDGGKHIVCLLCIKDALKATEAECRDLKKVADAAYRYEMDDNCPDSWMTDHLLAAGYDMSPQAYAVMKRANNG